jgi:hypothetical protein
MIAFAGRIVHRLELFDCSSTFKKQKRGPNEQLAAPTETTNSNEPWRSAGLYFLSDGGGTEFLLSVPQNHLKAACDAARFQLCVKIFKYSIIPLSSRASSSGENSLPDLSLLQIHSNGLQILGSKPPPNLGVPNDNIWTLSQFRRKEWLDQQENALSTRGEVYYISATVDAISPIVAMKPSDPFALIELYDADTTSGTHASCVVVFQKANVLVCHSAIVPGDVLILKVIRRLWPLSKDPMYQHLKDRIPPQVFVVTEATSVIWDDDASSTNSLMQLPLLAFTSNPLVSIRGTIVQVTELFRSHGDKKIRTIHWVEICDSKEGIIGSTSTFNLYLTHYPISPALQLSLVSGAVIQADNVHLLCSSLEFGLGRQGKSIFGACLRSTVSLLRPASEMSLTVEEGSSQASSYKFRTHPMEPPMLLAPLTGDGVIPFSFSEIGRPYREYIFRQHISGWLTALNLDGKNAAVPSVDVLASALLHHCKSEELMRAEDCDDLAEDCEETKAARNLGRNRISKRCPYAEFFDHQRDYTLDDAKQRCGCSMSLSERSQQVWPRLIDLDDIRARSLRLFRQRLVRLVEPSTNEGEPRLLAGGWTGSIHFTAQALFESPQGTDSSSSHGLYTGGFVCETDNDNLGPLSIRDRECQLPISSSKQETSPASPYRLGDFVVGIIDYVIVSCLCIATPKTTVTDNLSNSSDSVTGATKIASSEEVSLPNYGTDSRKVNGNCSVMKAGGYLFLVSVQLRCRSLLCFVTDTQLNGTVAEQRKQQKEAFRTVEACLLAPSALLSTNETVGLTGLLVRQRYRYAKVNTSNGFCECCLLTLSHAPNPSMNGYREFSCLQSIELKVAIYCESSKSLQLKRAISQIMRDMRPMDDQVALGVSWWTLANRGLTCALVAGGWDEFEKGSNATQAAVSVQLPSSAVSIGSRGYVRFGCKLEEIKASFTDVKGKCTENKKQLLRPVFDFVGGTKFLPGILDRRPPRRHVFGALSPQVVGELLAAPPSSGVPTCKMVDLSRSICGDLRNRRQGQLAPSLCRLISGAHFLGVSFCQAQCYCTRCFEPLISSVAQGRNKKPRREEDNAGPSFWHVPLPMIFGKQQCAPLPDRKQRRQISRVPEDSTLRCPRNCPAECYGVKWECNGILDDGTGQAKLYAELEAALTLLGMSSQVIEWIEQGAWSKENGLVRFSKPIPPPRQLQLSVEAVLYRSRNKQGDPLKLLNVEDRAEYLMQQHCRSSIARRKLDYFVRCKPLSDKAIHLTQTQTEVFFEDNVKGFLSKTDAATYSLPPLKLQLVDCCCPADPF